MNGIGILVTACSILEFAMAQVQTMRGIIAGIGYAVTGFAFIDTHN